MNSVINIKQNNSSCINLDRSTCTGIILNVTWIFHVQIDFILTDDLILRHMYIIIGQKLPIDQTQIPEHLEQMVVLLKEEELNAELDSTGPCMEYLLQHKLLDTLYSLGRTDVSTKLVPD